MIFNVLHSHFYLVYYIYFWKFPLELSHWQLVSKNVFFSFQKIFLLSFCYWFLRFFLHCDQKNILFMISIILCFNSLIFVLSHRSFLCFASCGVLIFLLSGPMSFSFVSLLCSWAHPLSSYFFSVITSVTSTVFIWFFFILIYLLRLSVSHLFQASNSVTGAFMTIALKSLLDNPNICIILAFMSADFLFSFK